MTRQTVLDGLQLMSCQIWDDKVSIHARWLFVCLLLKTTDEGMIYVDEDYRIFSEISGLGIRSARSSLSELLAVGLVEEGDHGLISIPDVDTFRRRQTQRQARTAERTRKWRERKCGDVEVAPPQTPPISTSTSTSTSTENKGVVGGGDLDVTSDAVTSDANEPPKVKRWADRPADVEEDVWLEFVSLRRTKKATATDRVIRGLRKQAGLAGLTLQEAMETCIQHGWTSIKAEWLQGKVRNRKAYKGSISEAGEIDF